MRVPCAMHVWLSGVVCVLQNAVCNFNTHTPHMHTDAHDAALVKSSRSSATPPHPLPSSPPAAIHFLTQPTHHPLSLPHSLTHTLTHPPSLSHSLPPSLSLALTHTLCHSLTHSLSRTHTLTHSLTSSLPHSHTPSQAASILKAEVYGIPRPDWATDQAAVAAAAGKVVVPEFQPKQGVKIETDPKVGWEWWLSWLVWWRRLGSGVFFAVCVCVKGPGVE